MVTGQPKAKPDRKEARKQRLSRRKANQQDPEKALNMDAPTAEQLAAVGAGNPEPVFRRGKGPRKPTGSLRAHAHKAQPVWALSAFHV